MALTALILRCLLAVALVAGGVPTLAMAGAVPADEHSAAMTSCHDLAAPEIQSAHNGSHDADCCETSDCACDCLQTMPAAALSMPALATVVFQVSAPAPRSFGRTSRIPSTTLRPPIG